MGHFQNLANPSCILYKASKVWKTGCSLSFSHYSQKCFVVIGDDHGNRKPAQAHRYHVCLRQILHETNIQTYDFKRDLLGEFTTFSTLAILFTASVKHIMNLLISLFFWYQRHISLFKALAIVSIICKLKARIYQFPKANC